MTAVAAALFVLLTSVSSPTIAQPALDPSDPVTPTDAEEAFERLKALAGSWVGQLKVPQEPGMDGKFAQFSLRVTSLGNALVHEFSVSSIPDHPVTMFYLDGDRLVATHYCDAGNRPRFVGEISPDGKTLEFDFLDLSGGDKHGHMHHVVFTFIDENHHREEWTYMMPNGKAVQARFDLQRTNTGAVSSAY